MTSKLTTIHEQARSYEKIKSGEIIDSLYKNFVPYNEIPDFPMQYVTRTGQIIDIVDDPAVIVGTAQLRKTNKKVAVIAQQMPSSDADRTRLNYGLVKADGYALALSMMTYAEENGLMLHTYIDTIGGDPFEYSAGKLQSWLISDCQARMISLKTKTISIVLGSGGSGGAIAFQLAHRRFMLARAEYSVITAEGCSAILFRSADKIEEALEVLQPTSDYMLKYGIVDSVIKEPPLTSSDYKKKVLANIEKAIVSASEELEKTDVNYLRENLVKKIQECGGVETSEHTYQAIAKKIRSWLPHYSFGKAPTPEVSHMQLALYGAEPHFCNDEKDPEGKIVRAGCRKHFAKEEFQRNYFACPYCEKPNPIGGHEYLDILLDIDSFHELHSDLSVEDIDNRFNFYDYSDARRKSSGRSESKDSLIVGYGDMYGLPVAIAVSEFRFMGGSMGAVFGEKMKLIVDYAIARGLPLVVVTASGGARMQEGTIALYQMAKTISSIIRLKNAGLPFISVLGHPTTGGALASYAVQGDFIISERKATVAFAGDRVVKLTSGGRGVDPGTMTAEFFSKKGGIHLVTERSQLKAAISGILRLTPWLRADNGQSQKEQQ
ncbi:MAG TPA: carboxyl transferase domain-containing protein [Thermodesulfobacteriota bacterium]|nr:carboxyl transferase domain-containing protein [Thermodesulfobacteriota bacterium]